MGMKNDAVHEALHVACRERDIRSAADFRARFGIEPAALTPQAALALVTTPDWVMDIWLRSTDPTPAVWIPAAVRAYAGAFGIMQSPDESDRAFNDRLKGAITERTNRAGRDRGPPPSLQPHSSAV